MSYYSPPPPPSGYYPQEPLRHPQSTTILVLGILGLVVCSPLAIVAWVMGNKALAEIDSSGRVYADRGMVKAGQVMGIVGTVLLIITVVGIAIIIAAVAAGGGLAATSPPS